MAEAVIFAMLASYLLSRTLIPTLAKYLLKPHQHHEEESDPNWYPVMDESAKTIIHSDYNPRNIGFRTLHSKPSVVILDWECVRWDIPQYDIAQSLRAMESRRRGRVVPGSLRAGCFSAGKI